MRPFPRITAGRLLGGRAGSARPGDPTLDSMSGPRAMARTLGLVYLGGASVALISMAFPQPPGTNHTGLYAIFAVAYAIGAALIALRDRLGAVALWAAVGCATILINLGIVFTEQRAGTYALFLVSVSVLAFFFMSRRAALAQVGLIGLVYGAVIVGEGVEGGAEQWVITAGTVLIAGLLVGHLRDRVESQIAGRERSEAALRKERDFLDGLLESMSDGVMACDANGALTILNRATRELHAVPEEGLGRADWSRHYDLYMPDGVTPMAAEDVPLFRAFRGERVRDLEVVIAPKNGGSPRTLTASGQPIVGDDGEKLGAVVVMHDVTERKRFESQLRYLAEHDAMTGLLNRRRFTAELERQVAYARRYGRRLAVVVLDLDNLKEVNDALGHGAGDQLVMEVARLLSGTLRETDMIGRLGGDEFGVALPELDSWRAEMVAQELVRAVQTEAALVEGQSVKATASAGIAVLDAGAEATAEELLVEADLAMYDAKERGGDRAALYRRDTERRVRARLDWASRIRRAVDEERFVVHLQPIVDLRTGQTASHEVLVRMSEEEDELVLPGTFLPVAERFGLMEAIDRLVLRRSLALIAEHRSAGRSLSLHVNVSARSLADAELPDAIERQLEASAVDPSALTLEVAETAAIANIAAARAFGERLALIGCGLVLDDFGAGFGSFDYLKHLPFDAVKIDGRFVRELARNPSDEVVVRALVELARGLRKRTIAEFVENGETLETLRRLGVDQGQGYHIRRPQPVGALQAGPAGAPRLAHR